MKVNVVILTYNHEKFIAQAIESVLIQETNFDYKILISDDASTDRTLEIINSYVNRYPNKISVFINENNEGVLYNVLKMMQEVKATYTALLDGDDLWSFEKKMQYQVDFLDKNSEYTATYHDANILHHDKLSEKILFSDFKNYSQSNIYKTETYPSDIIKRLIIPTSSILFKTDALKQVDKSFLIDSYSVAWKLFFFICLSSKFKYFNETWSQYRNHKKGISKNNEKDFYFSHIHFLKKLLADQKYSFLREEIYASICHQYLNYFRRSSKSFLKTSIRIKIDYILAEIKHLYFKVKNLK